MVDYVVRKMKKELQEYEGSECEVKVIATGGLAALIDAGIDCIDHVDKMLTLEGLRLIYEKNRKLKRHDHKHTLEDLEEKYEKAAF